MMFSGDVTREIAGKSLEFIAIEGCAIWRHVLSARISIIKIFEAVRTDWTTRSNLKHNDFEEESVCPIRVAVAM